MALTRGDRKNRATVSSIQSRMGVVSAYEGSGISDAAEAVSGVLNIEAQRRAEQEEVKWKLNYKLKTRETITDFARNNFDDPDTFTKLTDTYIATAEQEAPVRFKNYAKEFASNLAFEKGDVIWNEAKNKETVEILQDQALNLQAFIADRNETIMGMNGAEEEEYWFTNLLPEINDEVETYEQLFNGRTASVQATMDSPDAYKQALLLGFETVRLMSNAKDMLNTAQAADDAVFEKGVPRNYVTELSKVQKFLKKYSTSYQKDPNFDPSDSGAVYTNSNYDERQKIIESVDTFITDWNTSNQKEIDRKAMLQEVIKENNIATEIKLVENGNTMSEEDAKEIAYNLKMNEDQTKLFLKTNQKTKVIQGLSREITTFSIDTDDNFGSYYQGLQVKDNNGLSINQKVFNTQEMLEDMGIKMTSSEIKQGAMDMAMYNMLLTIRGDDFSMEDYYTVNLSSVIEGLADSNPFINGLVKLSNVYGEAPNRLIEYFDSSKSLDYRATDDQEQLAVMAKFANNINEHVGPQISLGDSVGNELFPSLVKLHKRLEKVTSTKNAATAGLTTKELIDVNSNVEKDRQNIIEQWYSQYVNPDATLIDEKIKLLNQIVEDNNLTFSQIIKNTAENEQEKAMWGFGFFDTDLMDSNREYNFVGRDKTLEPSFNFVVQEMGEQLKLRVANSFSNGNYQGEMTVANIKKAYKEYAVSIMNSVRASGYGFDENE